MKTFELKSLIKECIQEVLVLDNYDKYKKSDLESIRRLAKDAAELRLDGYIGRAKVVEKQVDDLVRHAEENGFGDDAFQAEEEGRSEAVEYPQKISEGDGENGYIAFYKGKRTEVYAKTSYEAQKKAAEFFKAKKPYEVHVELAEKDGKPVIQAPVFEDKEFGQSNLIFIGTGMDVNGNKIVQLKFPNQRAFSIQTNQNFPDIHGLSKGDALTPEMEKEIENWVSKYGSPNQKRLLRKYSIPVNESKQSKEYELKDLYYEYLKDGKSPEQAMEDALDVLTNGVIFIKMDSERLAGLVRVYINRFGRTAKEEIGAPNMGQVG